MRWPTVTHTRRWHAHHHTSGTGQLYQGRFKSFPVESDARHFLACCRYVARNALRAYLVGRAEVWRWSSLWRCVHGRTDTMLSAEWPVEEPVDWLALVNRPSRPASPLARSVGDKPSSSTVHASNASESNGRPLAIDRRIASSWPSGIMDLK